MSSPPNNPTSMHYGEYTFRPVPIITSLNEVYTRNGAGEKIGKVWRATLNGTLTPIPTGEAGIKNLIDLQESLEEALNEDGRNWRVECNGSTVISACVRVVEFDFNDSSDNWVNKNPYTVILEFDDNPYDELVDNEFNTYVQNVTNEWSLEFAEETSFYDWTLSGGTRDTNLQILRLTHTISAQGKTHYECSASGSGTLSKRAWEYAQDWVVPRLGLDLNRVSVSGTINLDSSTFSGCNHIRANSISESDGTYSVTESWVLIQPSGSGVAGKAIEDFTINLRTGGIESDITTVDIEGRIQGLEENSYGSSPGDFSITASKYDNAEEYWINIQSKLYGRAQKIATGEATRTLNMSPVSKLVGYSPTQGSITYTYSYDDRLAPCISNAISEVIAINDILPTDLLAEIVVIGRDAGNIIQDLSTKTNFERTLSIEAVVPVTGCDGTGCLTIVDMINANPQTEVDNFLCCIEQDLQSTYSGVFKTQDTPSWIPSQGRYSRTVTWKTASCSGNVSTSLC